MTWEEALGIKISILLSGIAGGVVSLTYEDKIPPLRAIGMIFCGGATAAYTQPVLTHYLRLEEVYANAIGFFLGLVSMKLVAVILNALDYLKKNPKLLLNLIPYVNRTYGGVKSTNDDSHSSERPPKKDEEHI